MNTMKRSHNNAELNISNLNKSVTLIGWVSKKRNLGSLVFVDLRDKHGITQVVFDSNQIETSILKSEYLIQVEGKVNKRKAINRKLTTGEIEVQVDKLNIISKSEQTPMLIKDETDALEDLRLKYRYLDLRRPIMQKKIITRHKIAASIREFLNKDDFIEIETPLLTKSTPEGARDYVVPSRINKSKFYALPQSPQLFKQLLMISGFEKYYQFARSFRDEDLRSDRQPDFTQIDIECSFKSKNEIMDMLEKMFSKLFLDVKNIELKKPFKTLTYKEAMNTYGSDKPDIRYNFKLVDVSDIIVNNNSDLFKKTNTLNGYFKAIKLKNLADDISRKNIDAFDEIVKKNHGKFLLWGKYKEEFSGPINKILDEKEKKELINKLNIKKGDIVFISASKDWYNACQAMGSLRKELGKTYASINKDDFKLLWVVDFPLFEKDEETNKIFSAHHPFTMPYKEDLKYLDSEPTKVRAHHFDLVMNGYELGSGSLRIYDQKVQEKVFNILGLSKSKIKEKFGFFVDAFKYGTPPHGGVGLGFDRIAMIMTNSSSIRDVIAFPKNASGICPMSEAPDLLSKEQLEELGIELKKK